MAEAKTSFPCQEKDCGQIVLVEGQAQITLQNGCRRTGHFYKCPGCGRIYGDDGNPVLSRGFEKAFFTDKGLENRPLDAHEKAEIIQILIKQAAGASENDVGYISFQLHCTVRQGHAADCKEFNCSCGLKEAEQFVVEHPVPKQYAIK